MRKAVILFMVAALGIAAFWWWRGSPVSMPPSPLTPGQKLTCVSYAPFRGTQTPLDPTTRISAEQIDADLKLLATLTDCVRTYSVDVGLDQVPEIARRHGLQVMLGLWVSNDPERLRFQMETGIALAKKHADVVRAVIVGNEALLRGDIRAPGLAELIRRVKSQVPMPVTYADVWEFWLQNRELQSVVDFVTVHILPYWEDDPIPAKAGAAHIASIRAHVAEQFPGKEVFIGEVGWPSAGRMREGALPSPASQAFVLHELFAWAAAEKFRFNLIEAFDQPWKRKLEGTVGGHWGLITDPPRQVKFAWGEPVSDHRFWLAQAAGGIAFAGLVFGAALWGVRRTSRNDLAALEWAAVGASALVGGALVGWSVEKALLESLGAVGWLRSGALLVVASGAPLVAAAAIASRTPAASFAALIGPRGTSPADPLASALGWLTMLAMVMALAVAVGLTFNPRYLDFPFASLTAAAIPLVCAAWLQPGGGIRRAEQLAAALLLPCFIFFVWNETPQNWQALWLAAALALLAITLARPRAAPG